MGPPEFKFASSPGAKDQRKSNQQGFTLAEMLVVLMIISTLAVVALPYAEKEIQRRMEWQLAATLRQTRSAIDEFHEDFKNGLIPETQKLASAHGYPLTIDILVDGFISSGPAGNRRRYLRGRPINPFAKDGQSFEQQWLMISSTDPTDASRWGGVDVFDLKPITDQISIRGEPISTW